jgi:hypothetical protein
MAAPRVGQSFGSHHKETAMYNQQPLDPESLQLEETSANILAANGYRIVSDDRRLFPSLHPDLAVLKDGELIVFAVKSFDLTEEFLSPEHLNDIRAELEAVIAENHLSTTAEVKQIAEVALVMTPENVTVASESGDIQWLLVQDYDELPELIDKVMR